MKRSLWRTHYSRDFLFSTAGLSISGKAALHAVMELMVVNTGLVELDPQHIGWAMGRDASARKVRVALYEILMARKAFLLEFNGIDYVFSERSLIEIALINQGQIRVSNSWHHIIDVISPELIERHHDTFPDITETYRQHNWNITETCRRHNANIIEPKCNKNNELSVAYSNRQKLITYPPLTPPTGVEGDVNDGNLDQKRVAHAAGLELEHSSPTADRPNEIDTDDSTTRPNSAATRRTRSIQRGGDDRSSGRYRQAPRRAARADRASKNARARANDQPDIDPVQPSHSPSKRDPRGYSIRPPIDD